MSLGEKGLGSLSKEMVGRRISDKVGHRKKGNIKLN